MVKRQTNFKQVYLVDALGLNYINNQNQNSISHNVSLSIPKTNDGSYYPIKPQTLQNSIEQNEMALQGSRYISQHFIPITVHFRYQYNRHSLMQK